MSISIYRSMGFNFVEASKLIRGFKLTDHLNIFYLRYKNVSHEMTYH